MKIERLTTNIGARVSGLDLREVRQSQREDLRGLLEDNLVLFFVGQKLNLDEFQHFGEVMGELVQMGALPGYRGPDDLVARLEVPAGTRRGRYADRWHTDEPYLEQPTYATMLMPDRLPSSGGDTCWANMYTAYELLSEPLRRFADGLYAVQSSATVTSEFKGEHTHPVVRVNPKTGRRALYVNSIFTRDILDLPVAEAKEVLELLVRLSTPQEAQVRYRWTPDTVAIWDNRFTQHYAVRDYDEPRGMFRMIIRGEPVHGLRG
jgi:taurine dioxygenase